MLTFCPPYSSKSLADKYAPASPEIAETLAKLQLPPEIDNSSLHNTCFVPLPKRTPASSKHQIAVIIREGRRVASTLAEHGSLSSTILTAMSTMLEQDFTVQGTKRGSLGCPFSQPKPEQTSISSGHQDPTPHQSADPICAAMYAESTPKAARRASNAASKCPIRYLDQHSPEEIGHYLETHKHDLPRSHEVCLRRYQRSDEEIRKLDAKYGNLANMVEGLTKIHQPLMPEEDTRPRSDMAISSIERVETWAQTVDAADTIAPNEVDRNPSKDDGGLADEDEREGRFDRPLKLKEVRVGESPSRPWGISVPLRTAAPSIPGERPDSPPPAPVFMAPGMQNSELPPKGTGQCPFGHGKPQTNGLEHPEAHGERESYMKDGTASKHSFDPVSAAPVPEAAPPRPAAQRQPSFLNTADLTTPKSGAVPQIVFNGPVFIGYPVEQAIQLLQHLQRPQ